MTSEQINSTVDKLLNDVNEVNVFSVAGIIRLLPHLVKLVEQIKGLKGFEKKDLVINTLTELVTRKSPSDTDVTKMLDFIHDAGNTLVDVYVFAARSKDMIKKTHSKLKSCLCD